MLEVILAVAILSIGFIAAMSIATTAADRLMKAVVRWERQHMLNQATEYFLLAGPDAAIPQEFFPFQGYSAKLSSLSQLYYLKVLSQKIIHGKLLR